MSRGLGDVYKRQFLYCAMHKQVIALIDDDRNILTSLSIALEKEGFKVQTYIDGESALIGLTEHRLILQ